MSNGNSLSSSSPARSTTAIAAAAASLSIDDYQFPTDLISIQDHKDEALVVLKSDLMAVLNKEVKSLDEDSWMFEGPDLVFILFLDQVVFCISAFRIQSIITWPCRNDVHIFHNQSSMGQQESKFN